MRANSRERGEWRRERANYGKLSMTGVKKKDAYCLNKENANLMKAG